MKKLILILLLASACTHIETKQQRAENLINTYIKSTLNEPDSYESVSFGNLCKLKDTSLYILGKSELVKYDGRYEVLHIYRVKNQFGGIVTKSDWFQLDSAITVATCCFLGQNNK